MLKEDWKDLDVLDNGLEFFLTNWVRCAIIYDVGDKNEVIWWEWKYKRN